MGHGPRGTVVTDVVFDIRIEPEARRMNAAGHYALRNDSGAPIREVMVRQGDKQVANSRLDLAGARLARHDTRHGVRIHHFDTPLAPGAAMRLDFVSQLRRRGLPNRSPARLAESIDVGVFTARPGASAFVRADVPAMKRYPIRAGRQVIEVITSGTRPTFAGVDPYNFTFDRNSDDNLVPVSYSTFRPS